jgi:hypothetical protein
MSETTTPTQEASPEQLAALARAEGAMAHLRERLEHVKTVTARSKQQLAPCLAFAEERLAEIARLEAALEPLKQQPDQPYAATALRIQRRLFEGSRDVAAIAQAFDDRNHLIAERALGLLDACGGNPNAWARMVEEGVLDPHFSFPMAIDDPDFQRARAQTTLHLGLHLWLANIDGIDAILRATETGEALEPRDAAEAAGREAIADEVRALMDRDAGAARWLSGLGAELDEVFTYLQWASQKLRGLEGVPAEARRERMADPDWIKLAGKVQVLADLIPRARQFPDLARFFPALQPAGLPADQLA